VTHHSTALAKRRGITVLMQVVLALVGVFAATVVAQGTASAATTTKSAPVAQAAQQTVQLAQGAQTTQGVHPNASYYCSYTWNSQRVDANCNVYSGYVRLWGTCSNGYTYYTPWVTGYGWHLWVTCGSYRLLRFGFQSIY